MLKFNFPFDSYSIDQLNKAHDEAKGGNFPFGRKNRSWHGGMHFSIKKESAVKSIADGKLIAYRYSTISDDLIKGKDISSSFVLLEHNYKTLMGSNLNFYSLYMHLDPKSSLTENNGNSEVFPKFVSECLYKVNKNLDAYALCVIVKDEKKFHKGQNSSIYAIPFGAKIKVIEKVQNKKKWNGLKVEYTDLVGNVISGIILDSENKIKKINPEKDNDGHYIFATPDSSKFKNSSGQYKYRGCISEEKGLKGTLVYSGPSKANKIVGILPKDTEIDVEKSENNWVKIESLYVNNKLISHDELKNRYYDIDEFWIPSKKIKVNKEKLKLDDEKTGKTIVVDKDTTINVKRGDLLGYAGNSIGKTSKNSGIVHVEIFSLDPMMEKNSFLTDPKNDNLLCEKKSILAPIGTPFKDSRYYDFIFKKGDKIKVQEIPSDSNYIKISIDSIIREVPKSFLSWKTKSNSRPDGIVTSGYFKVNNEHKEFDSHNKKFYNLLEKDSILYWSKKTNKTYQAIFYPNTTSSNEFWVKKEILKELLTPPLIEASSTIFPLYTKVGTEYKQTDGVGIKKGDEFVLKDSTINENFSQIEFKKMQRGIDRQLLNGYKNNHYDLSYDKKIEKEIVAGEARTFDDVEKEFNHQFEVGKNVLRLRKQKASLRIVELSGKNIKKSELWINIIKNVSFTLKNNIDEIFKNSTPEDEKKLDQEIVLPFINNQSKWLPVNNSKNQISFEVNIENLKPFSPLDWNDWEFLFEKNPNYDAFVDINELTTQKFNEENELEDTESSKELFDTIKTGIEVKEGELPKTFNISKVYENEELRKKVSKFICRFPTEWKYTDERWKSLFDCKFPSEEEKENTKKLIQEICFWDKVEDVYIDKSNKDKEFFYFNVLSFIEQMQLISNSFMDHDKFEEFKLLINTIYTCTENKLSEENCKLLSGLFFNRINSMDWVDCPKLSSVLFKSVPKIKNPKDEDFLQIAVWISDIFKMGNNSNLDKKYLFYHKKEEDINKQPWDISDLDIDTKKELGDFVFYSYKNEHNILSNGLATELSVSYLEITNIDTKKCLQGTAFQNKKNEIIKISVENEQDLNLKYDFNITNGFEEERKSLKWKVIFDKKTSDGKLEATVLEVENLDINQKTFSFKINSSIAGYRILFEPYDENDNKLNDGFALQLLQEDYIRFDGNNILWVKENGDLLNWTINKKEVDKLPANTGFKNDNGELFCQVPAGEYILKNDNLETLEGATEEFWMYHPSNTFWGFNDWGKQRIKLQYEVEQFGTEEDEDIYIHGGTSQFNHIALAESMDVFIEEFHKRVPKGDQIKLIIQYRPFYSISRYQTDKYKTDKKWEILSTDSKSNGTHVETLQKDLLNLGYWINTGTSNPSNTDKTFGDGLFSAIKTFQLEHKNKYSLELNGKLDEITAKAIINLLNDGNNYEGMDLKYQRPGLPVDLSSLQSKHFCYYANNKPARPKRFYQLPPPKNNEYKRYGEIQYTLQSGDLQDCYHNDIWGAKETIEALTKFCYKWYDKHSTDIVEVGDIALWTGGDMKPHGSHKDGYGIDIRTNKAGKMNHKSYKFDKDRAVEFAALAGEVGFGRIFTLCPYVAEETNNEISKNLILKTKYASKGLKAIVTLDYHHEHHFHFDYYPEGMSYGTSLNSQNLSRAYCKDCVWNDTCDYDSKENYL